MVELLYEIDGMPRAKKQALKKLIDARLRGSEEADVNSVPGMLFRIQSLPPSDKQQVVQYLTDEVNLGY